MFLLWDIIIMTIVEQENKILQKIKQSDIGSIEVGNVFGQDGYTTESAWGYPNNVNTQYYNQMGKPYNFSLNNTTVDYSLYGRGFSKDFINQMLDNKDYQRALIEYAIPNEGGYVFDPRDLGAETNMGISKRYHPDEDIKNLTRERANILLYDEIWNWNGINRLPSEVVGFVFDHGIRTSPQNAIETTHRALNIPLGGTIIGETTLKNLQNIGYEEFLRRYKNLVNVQDKLRSTYNVHGKGWDNRTEKYHLSYW